MPHAHQPPKPARKGKAWSTSQGPKFQSKHGLSDEEVRDGQDEFLQTTADVLLPRQQAAVWLELCKLRKKGRVRDWKKGVLVSDCGSSVGWLTVAKDMCPCIRPGNSYLILDQGEPKLAQGLCDWPCKVSAQKRPKPLSSFLKKMPRCASWLATRFVLTFAWLFLSLYCCPRDAKSLCEQNSETRLQHATCD